MRGSRRPYKASWGLSATSCTLDSLCMPGGVNLQPHQATGALLLILQISDNWTTFCEIIEGASHVFCSQSCTRKTRSKGPCRDENGGMRRRIASEDTHRQIIDQTLQGNHPEMQILALFQLWEFVHFSLRYMAPNGIILRVFWLSTQRCLSLVSKWWEFLKCEELLLRTCLRSESKRTWRKSPRKQRYQDISLWWLFIIDYVVQWLNHV